MGEVYKAMMSLGYVSYIRLKHTKTSDLSPPETISAEFDVSSNGNICLCMYISTLVSIFNSRYLSKRAVSMNRHCCAWVRE